MVQRTRKANTAPTKLTINAAMATMAASLMFRPSYVANEMPSATPIIPKINVRTGRPLLTNDTLEFEAKVSTRRAKRLIAANTDRMQAKVTNV